MSKKKTEEASRKDSIFEVSFRFHDGERWYSDSIKVLASDAEQAIDAAKKEVVEQRGSKFSVDGVSLLARADLI